MHSIYRTIVFLAYSAAVYGGQQHLRFDGEARTYEITFDDSRISVNQMKRIAPLSPFVEFSPEFIIGIEATKRGGKEVQDKVFMAPRSILEMPSGTYKMVPINLKNFGTKNCQLYLNR
jgi:hypothetical protein